MNFEKKKNFNFVEKNVPLCEFIITYKKRKEHIGNIKNFEDIIQKALHQNINYLSTINPIIKHFQDLISQENDFFNIYIDLNQQALTKNQIQKLEILIENKLYHSHQILDARRGGEAYLLFNNHYPYLETGLMTIINLIHLSKKKTNLELLQQLLFEINPRFKNDPKNTEIIINTVLLFNIDKIKYEKQ